MGDPFDDEKVLINEIFPLTTLYDQEPLQEGVNEGSNTTAEVPGQPISSGHLLKISKSDSESCSDSPGSHTLGSSTSGSDYLDSDLVKVAIERLSIDDISVLILDKIIYMLS